MEQKNHLIREKLLSEVIRKGNMRIAKVQGELPLAKIAK